MQYYIMNIAFFVRHFTERGTEVAIYDYAKYNKHILNNNSIIICFTETKQRSLGLPTEKYSYDKFKSKFTILEINDIQEMSDIIKNYNLHFFYTLTHGGSNDIYQFENKLIWGNCKTIKHCVFDTTHPESDFYISISDMLNSKLNTNIPVIPHIVDLPNCVEDLRDDLHIPKDAIVFGRYGGYDEFNINIAREAIIDFLHVNNNSYFLFMNTNKFYEHPRIIYVDKNVNLVYKVKFINTCDAMIHARDMGETFGLSIAEFSIKNKPVITCPCGDLEHIKILGDKALTYTSKESLIHIFTNIKDIIKSRYDWNAYTLYSPEYVMSLFKNIIFNNYKLNICSKKTYIYIHVCCINNWMEVFDTLILDIKKSGLYNKIHEIRCNILTETRDNFSFFNHDKIKIIGTSSNLNAYETSTLRLLYQHSLLEDFNVLYLHTKGIRHNNTNINITDWVKYLSYFNIYKHDICINQLSNFDAVGVNLQNEPHFHYSGNFWWSKSKYIKKLSLPIQHEYNSPEFWITKTKIGNYLSLWKSNINHYCHRYTEDKYIDKNIDIEKAYKVISYTPIKIIDCFIFYNEFDLLTYRLNVLNDVVDYFVLVESTHTFVGKEKPLFYNENKQLFEKFNHKIIHVIVDDFPHKYPNINFENREQWTNEAFQRNCISRGLSSLNLQPTDIITITDVDEIPNPSILENIKTNILQISVNILEMDFYYYNLNTRMNNKWHHAKILSFQKYKELNLPCDNIRFYDCQIIPSAGWHLSYFGNEKFIKNKLENFSHQEYNKTEFTNEKQIEERIKNKSDLFGRTGINMTNIPIKENTNLPCLYDKYLTQFITE